MSNARNLADIISGAFDVPAGALDNVEGLPDAIDVNASAPADSVAIDASGNVGIGTTSPSGTLHLSNGSGSALQYLDSSNGQGTLYFRDTSSNLKGQIESQNDGTMFIATRASAPIQFATNNSERARLDSGGAFMVGTTSRPSSGSNPGTFIEQTVITIGSNTTAAQDRMRFENPNGRVGKIECSGSSTNYITSSDYRLKENVVDMTGAITRVKSLAPKRFNWIADADDTTVDGFLAHEAQSVVPEAVSGTQDAVDADGNPEYQGIDQSKLVPLLTGALKEAIAKIETLEARVDALENA